MPMPLPMPLPVPLPMPLQLPLLSSKHGYYNYFTEPPRESLENYSENYYFVSALAISSGSGIAKLLTQGYILMAYLTWSINVHKIMKFSCPFFMSTYFIHNLLLLRLSTYHSRQGAIWRISLVVTLLCSWSTNIPPPPPYFRLFFLLLIIAPPGGSNPRDHNLTSCLTLQGKLNLYLT